MLKNIKRSVLWISKAECQNTSLWLTLKASKTAICITSAPLTPEIYTQGLLGMETKADNIKLQTQPKWNNAYNTNND